MRLLALFLLLALSASAQPPLRFEVASIRPTQMENNRVTVGFTMDGHIARFTAVPLGYYIATAYEIKASQIVGPGQLQDRFDITATIPEGVKQDKLAEMLKGLLEDRFQLKFHRDNRDTQVYVITPGKGQLQLKESAETPSSNTNTAVTAGGTGAAEGISLNLGNGSSFNFANNKWEGKKLTWAEAAEQLEIFVDHPIVDQTNLKGRYDFALEMTPDDYQMMRAQGAINAGFPIGPRLRERLDTAQYTSLYEAFEKLGLKLESKKLPQPVIIVDSVLKLPTEN